MCGKAVPLGSRRLVRAAFSKRFHRAESKILFGHVNCRRYSPHLNGIVLLIDDGGPCPMIRAEIFIG